MPHYKDGTKAELFDEVIAKPYGKPMTGVVTHIQEGSTTCNLSVAKAEPKTYYKWDGEVMKATHKIPMLTEVTLTAAECERIDLHVKRLEDEARAAAPAPSSPSS